MSISPSSEALAADTFLKTRRDFPRWFIQLELNCVNNDLWHLVNPDAPDARNPIAKHKAPTAESVLIEEKSKRALQAFQEDPVISAGSTPLPPTEEEVKELLKEAREQYRSEAVDRLTEENRYQRVWLWVTKTVDPNYLGPAERELLTEARETGEKPTLQKLVRIIRTTLSPTQTSTQTQVIEDYQAVLKRAHLGGVEPEKWCRDWLSAYTNGKAYGISEVEGTIASKAFLNAIRANMAPEWGRGQIAALIGNETLGLPTLTLRDHGILFSAMCHETSQQGQLGIFATLGGRSPSNVDHSKKKSQKGGANQQEHLCPCQKDQDRKHRWLPETCYWIQYALTGSSEVGLRKPPTPQVCAEIRERIKQNRWSGLRKKLTEKGWINGQSVPSSTRSGGSTGKFPPNEGVVAATLMPDLLNPELLEAHGVYSTTSFSRHPLADSTLLDNCGAPHLVNDKSLLIPGSFVQTHSGRTIEAGTSSLPIKGEGKRIFRGAFNGANGPGTVDLTLENVVVVEGFHTNIISEARLRSVGIWLDGYHCSLRYGTPEENVELRRLERRFNLTFFEYKPFSQYTSIPRHIPTSDAGIVLMPTMIRRKRNRPWKPSVDYLRPRTDSEALWHIRSGHLGPVALRALVLHARNVKIEGTARIECEHCSKAHATKQVSKRSSQHRSPRPFWRISWDLFDFPRGYDGAQWLLLIKDEYSGKIFGSYLKEKALTEVFITIHRFESWVRRQYRLAICKIRQDNDTSVIAINGETEYQRWAKEEGIDLELTPTHTSEPNGGSERAGQEVITKSIKMLHGANIPEKLYPEVGMAAIWLHNMSPRTGDDQRSPNEVLESWFTQYFRWYSPEIVRTLTADLRPDWSGIYAYGCRAYVLMKERERNLERRAFKVRERGNLGYLVGYLASNIYRIWIPQLRSVITTRNVRFDETKFYNQDDRSEEIPAKEAEEIADVLNEPLGNISPELESVLQLMDNWVITEPGSTTGGGSGERNDLGGEPLTQSPLSGHSGDQDSGVGVLAGNQKAPGLLTPQQTPEPQDVVSSGSGAQGANAQPDRLPTVGQSDIEVIIPDTRQESRLTGGTAVVGPQQGLAQARDHPAAHEETPQGAGQVRSAAPNGENEREKPKRKYEKKVWAPASRTSQRIRDQPKGNPEQRSQEEGPPSAPSTAPPITRSNSEDPIQESITVRQEEQPKPKQKKSKKAVSRRIRNRSPDELGSEGAGSGVYSTVSYGEEGIMLPSDRNWENFISFFHEVEDVVEKGDLEHKTIHAVFAASVNQKAPTRMGAAPSRGRIHRNDLMNSPTKWSQLKDHPLGEEFKQDAIREINTLTKKNVWRVIKRSMAQGNPLPQKWVFTYKFNEEGYLEQCKSRVCVRGDLQEIDTLQSTYAATLAAKSFRMAIAIAAQFDLEIKQFDVITAFLNASREGSTPVECELPEGFKQDGYCVELERALYGLRDSPLLWYKEFSSTLRKLGLIASTEEPCLFYDELRKIILVFYVDDILVMYHKENTGRANEVIAGLNEPYDLKVAGDISWFLGIKVTRDRAARKITLTHDSYIEKITTKYDQAGNAHIPAIPLPVGDLVKSAKQASKQEIKRYQERIGSILYTAIMLRPDVAFAASTLSKFLTNPGDQHFKAANQVLRYLYNTRFLGISYGDRSVGAQALLIAGDASFADDEETRRSSQGYVMMLFGGAIHWKAARQNTVTTSTTEAEMLALTLTAKELMALKRLFRDIQLDLGEPWRIYCDNQQAIRLVVGESERISTKLRHVDIHNLWARQEHSKGSFEVTYLPTDQMPADGLTKSLGRQAFERFRALLNLQFVRTIMVEDV
jgi:hypothetical protein